MKFSVQNKAILARMSAIGKVISQKCAIPVLGCFLVELDGKGGTVTITGTDMDMVMSMTLQADEAEGSGRVCVDARRILELLKAAPEGKVAFTVDEASAAVKIRYASGVYDIMGRSAADFPVDGEIADPDCEGSFSVPSRMIADAMGKVRFAAGTDDLRPNLKGVYWDVKPDALTFVATDIKCLAKYRTTAVSPGCECSFILPSKAIEILCGAFAQDATVQVRASASSVHFITESTIVKCTKIKGMFPKYDRVIPRTHSREARLDREALASAVRRVTLCSDARYGLVKMTFAPESLTLVAQNAGSSLEGREAVPCAYTGDGALEIGFSGFLMGAMLGAMDTAGVTVRMESPTTPALLFPSENDEHGELTLLSMPMAIGAGQ